MNISEEIKAAYKDGSHQKNLNISFPDIDYDVPLSDVYYESMQFDESIFDGDSFEVVGCIASKFEISIRDTGENLKGERIVVTISIDDIQDSDIPLFYGYVDSVDREAQKKMQKIVAYDALYSKGDIDVAEWYKNLSFPISLGDLRDSLFTYIGLSQETTNLPNDSVVIRQEYSPNTLKALIVIKSLCQINGCFGVINRNGVFEYRFLDVSVSPEPVSFYREMDYKDYTIRPVNLLTIRQDSNDAGIVVGTGVNNYIIQGNMFTYNLESSVIYNIATNIYPYLTDIVYIPFEATNNGYPWVELGDNCALQYSIYDFDASTSEQSVYKNVTVIALKRSMSGIQNLIDVYSAQGQRSQNEFISEVNAELSALQQTVDNLIKHMSTEITTYRNPSIIVISEGDSVTIADLVYEASQGNTILLHEEATLEVEANEEFEDNTYTEGDVSAVIRYYVNGYRLANHVSETVLQEGKHLLNLMQFWEAGEKDLNRVQVKMEVTGGTVTIQKLNAKAYITVKQSDYNDAGIEADTTNAKIVYNVGETLDFTGVVINKVYFDESIPKEDVTDMCEFNPPEGTVVTSATDLIEITATYTEENELGEIKTYETKFYMSAQYLVSISAEEYPTKDAYFIGDTLDLTGVKIIADFVDGTTKDVTADCVYSPADGYEFISESEGKIIVSYTDHGITKTTELYVSVQKVLPEELIVDSVSVKKVYYQDIGQKFDFHRLHVYCRYNNGDYAEVTEDENCTVDPPDETVVTSSTSSYITVSYTYNDSTVTGGFDVEILPVEFDLKYFNYEQDDEYQIIILHGLNADLIAADGVGALEIPDHVIHKETGVPYTVIIQ